MGRGEVLPRVGHATEADFWGDGEYGVQPAPTEEAARQAGQLLYRHSFLTHLREQGTSPLMLMAKSRHKKPENARRCFKPSPEAVAELANLLAPDGRPG